MSFREWIILRAWGQTWYNYFIPPTRVVPVNRGLLLYNKIDYGEFYEMCMIR